MARGDGVNRTNVRNIDLTAKEIANVQRHNEREKESYANQDIIPDKEHLNVHFKSPTGGYAEMFAKMEADGDISTRGLKGNANLYGELIFDVNSAFFYNHGGYDFAKQFYADAYQSATDIVGGEQYILSAVMHADERNRAMSEALQEDVYHYHLHVVYVPVVEKQILWSKRCKDKELIGEVKETIMQVSSSKKWLSKPVLDESGNLLLQKNGKPILRKSYSVLQDDFYSAMRKAGYDDVERGERGSSEEHLTVIQFKSECEQERLNALERIIEKKEEILHQVKQKTKIQKGIVTSFSEIESMGRKTITGKVEFTQQEAIDLKDLAKEGVASRGAFPDLCRKLEKSNKDASIWRKYEQLYEQTKEFVWALKRAPQKLKALIRDALSSEIEKPVVGQKRGKSATKEKARNDDLSIL